MTDITENAVETVAREFVPHVIQFSQLSAKLSALREKYASIAPINFNDEQIARLEKFAQGCGFMD